MEPTEEQASEPSQPQEGSVGSSETLEQMQARHRKELRELQNRITSKKKNATKKTRRGVNHECETMENDLRRKQAAEIAALGRDGTEDDEDRELEAQTDANIAGLENVTKGLHQASLAESSASAEPVSAEPVSAEPQEAGKKRNRQRERLARRAAEQEAAAIAAEEEAANMVDKRKIESAHMKAEMDANGLVQQDIRPDGHCLFAAIADQLDQLSVPLSTKPPPTPVPAYRIVRQRAADFMVEHADDFAPFLETTIDKHADTIRDTAEWGGHVELMALARAYGVEIRVVQEGRTEKINEGEGEAIWLAYYRHGYGLGEHYNSLRKKTGEEKAEVAE